ncbi:MAG: hypothetical protein OJF52_003930 [Nitrospira sp.]|jgi:hypothetical protein|nr:MAG: hypothetical protein OJF52_003930 [Nitrospira sp.]
MSKMTILGSIVLSGLLLSPALYADEGGKQGRKATSMKVSGVVSKV